MRKRQKQAFSLHIWIMALAMIAGLSVTVPSAQAGPNCTCRHAGDNHKIGEVICIRGQLARCEMVLNNTNWRFIADFCPLTYDGTPLLRQLAKSGSSRTVAKMTPIPATLNTGITPAN